jgi:O-antigen/teichoic acid export membrane protein
VTDKRHRAPVVARYVMPLLAVVDQGMSSATNIALAVVVAATGTRDEFGALGLVSALYLFEVALVRGGVGNLYMVLHPDLRRAQRRDAVGTAVWIGLALGALTLPAGLLADGPLRPLLLAYAVATPGLIVQDTARYMLYAQRQPLLNLESNIIWATVQIVLSIVAVAAGSPVGLLLAWALGGWASAAYCLRQLRCPPWPRGWATWFRGRVKHALSWTTESFVQQGVTQVLVWTIGAVAGLGAVGAYRGAVVLTGPATVIIGGLALGVVLPASVRRAHEANASLERFVTRRVVPAFSLLAVVVLAPLLLLPDRVGEWILSDTWSASRGLLPIMVAGRILDVVTLSFVLGMRALSDRRWSLYLRLIAGAAMLVGASAAAVRWGATGAAAVQTIVSAVQLPLWLLVFVRTVRSSTESGAADDVDHCVEVFPPVDEPKEGVAGPVLGKGGLRTQVAELTRAGLERYPAIYLPLARRRNPARPLLDRTTDLVIEGFPRSGNTFLVSWVSHANPQLRIASHLHSVAHVRAALGLGVPVVVVLRDPEHAISSELIRVSVVLGSPPPITAQLARYQRFYEGIARHPDQLTLSPFETTTHAPERVVEALRARWGMPLSVVPATEAAQVLADVDERTVAARGGLDELAVARPSAQRQEISRRVRDELRSKHAPALDGLRELHDTLAASPASVGCVQVSDGGPATP